MLEINGDYGPPAPAGPATGPPAARAGARRQPRALPLAPTATRCTCSPTTTAGTSCSPSRPHPARPPRSARRAPASSGAGSGPSSRPPGRAGPAPGRPVVLLARHRPVPPHAAAALADELGNASGGLYTASMPAAAYARTRDLAATAAVLALVRLPGHAGEPFWTLSTPDGLTARIGAPPPHDIQPRAARPAGDPGPAPVPVTRQRAVAWNGAGYGSWPWSAGPGAVPGCREPARAPRGCRRRCSRPGQQAAACPRGGRGYRGPAVGQAAGRACAGRRDQDRAGTWPGRSPKPRLLAPAGPGGFLLAGETAIRQIAAYLLARPGDLVALRPWPATRRPAPARPWRAARRRTPPQGAR